MPKITKMREKFLRALFLRSGVHGWDDLMDALDDLTKARDLLKEGIMTPYSTLRKAPEWTLTWHERVKAFLAAYEDEKKEPEDTKTLIGICPKCGAKHQIEVPTTLGEFARWYCKVVSGFDMK